MTEPLVKPKAKDPLRRTRLLWVGLVQSVPLTMCLINITCYYYSFFLLGAVLEQFFAKYVSINSYTETVVKTIGRGEIIRWPARIGRRQTL